MICRIDGLTHLNITQLAGLTLRAPSVCLPSWIPPSSSPSCLPYFPPCSINGLTHLNITKLDVLSDLDEIKVG